MMKRLVTYTLAITTLLATAQVNALQPGDVSFDPEALNFPSLMVTTCRPKKIEATNDSDTPIENAGFTLEGDDVFSIQSGFQNCPSSLPPGETCSVYVDFCPQAHERYKASLIFAGSEIAVAVKGRGSAGPGGGR